MIVRFVLTWWAQEAIGVPRGDGSELPSDGEIGWAVKSIWGERLQHPLRGAEAAPKSRLASVLSQKYVT